MPNAVAQSNYFVSSSSGDDKLNGLSVDTAWASLERVNSAVLRPGDLVQFKAGDSFFGQLVIDESGSAEKPIYFTSFGAGEPPVIDGGNQKIMAIICQRSLLSIKIILKLAISLLGIFVSRQGRQLSLIEQQTLAQPVLP